MSRRIASVIAVVTMTALAGCQLVGPNSIGRGRANYNNIIQRTSMEQTMSNIVRVYHHEPPFFMDVTEVNAGVTFTGTVTGQSANIGAKHAIPSTSTVAGQVGTAGGTLTYTENPNIHYVSLTGQALVAQLVTPVSVDALGLLYDSSWDVSPLLDFSAAYLTLDTREFYPALETIEELSSDEAIELAAAPSGFPKAADDSSSKKSGSNNDSLVIYLKPFRAYDASEQKRILQLWVRMFRLYYQNQPPFKAPANCAQIGLQLGGTSFQTVETELRNWDVNVDRELANSKLTPDDARECLPNFIELRVVPRPVKPESAAESSANQNKKAQHPAAHRVRAPRTAQAIAALPRSPSGVPLMRTYSALGILKNATERPHPKIEFVTPEEYQTIRFGDRWNKFAKMSNYYILSPKDLDSVDCSDAEKQEGGCDSAFPPGMPKEFAQNLNTTIENWLLNWDPQKSDENYPNGLGVYERSGQDLLSADYVNYNGLLGTLRRYILVIVSDEAPTEPTYVSYTDGERWYYIAKDDEVSQKNFQLISLITTMMAIPPTTQPLTPVISIGGG